MSDEVIPGLLAVERREHLMAIFSEENKIDVATAAKRMGVSSETIRKDLRALSDQGLLRRVHGGALPIHSVAFEESVEQRTSNLPEKRRIAERAAKELPSEGAIFIDSGSTSRIVTEWIPETANLTVFTNSIPVVKAMFSKSRIPCYLVGGRTRAISQSTVGKWALAELAEIRVDVAFVGTNAVSFERGLSAPDSDEAAIKASMLNHAQKVVLMADHSKFDQESMFSYAPLEAIDLVVTGKEMPDQLRARMTEFDVDVIYS